MNKVSELNINLCKNNPESKVSNNFSIGQFNKVHRNDTAI